MLQQSLKSFKGPGYFAGSTTIYEYCGVEIFHINAMHNIMRTCF